jgi:hypothetical protein
MTPSRVYREDLSGKIFDNWTVLKFDRYSGTNGLWICRCTCGEERSIRRFHLIHGQYRSCGCLDVRKGWIIDGIGYIPLTQGQVTKVSPHRVQELQKINWRASRVGDDYYAYRGNTRRGRGSENGHMARWILGMDPSDPRRADHINGDTLDNRDENLRIADNHQSIWNRGINRNNTTGAKGVIRHKSWGKFTGKFKVRIMYKGREIDLGVCDTVEEGRRIYDEAARRLYGEFARVADKEN